MRAEDFTGAAKLIARKHYHDAMPPDDIIATFSDIGGKVAADTGVTQPIALMTPAAGLSPSEATNDLERELLILVNKGRADPGPAEMGSILQELAGEDGDSDLLPPVNVEPPVITPSSAAVGDTLTCSTGVWNNAPTRYEYAWRHVASSEIGLNAPTLPLYEGDVGKLITCRVTPFNAAGSSYADAEAVGPITETR
jgi:hypothetical protein